MDTALSDVRSGIKTFFVVPELSVFPEECLRAFCLHGYEAYFIHDDPYCPLVSKIHLLVSAFPEVILFFNIDRKVQGVDWAALIRKLQFTYRDRIRIGVMFQKLNNPDETRRLERLYLYDIGITCGCIPIEYQKSKNLPLFLSVLSANKANGQRKHLRAVCNDAYRMNMSFKGRPYTCVIRDVSVSHFSCVFIGEVPEIPMMEKIQNVQMSLRGTRCTVDAVLCLRRDIGDNPIHVFVFRTQDGRDGLDYEPQERVNSVIFNYYTETITGFLRKLFEAERMRISVSRNQQPAPNAAEAAESGELNLDVEKLLASVT